MPLANLGLGTSQLMGRVGRKQSLRLMETAFQAGIRPLDTAPLYGLGAAEGMVGEFAANKRTEIIIATKFGIRPPGASAWIGLAKTSARAVVWALPSLRVKLRRRAERMAARGTFTPEECSESLRMSLQQLRTQRIDLFLMHEVLPEQITTELLQSLEEATRNGLIGTFGVATTVGAAAAIAPIMRPGAVAQFPSSMFRPATAEIADSLLKITHSALGANFLNLVQQLDADKAALKKWSSVLQFDCSDTDQLGRLFLYGAMSQNAGGTVLFSSLSEERIRRNAALISEAPFTPTHLELLAALLKTATNEQP